MKIPAPENTILQSYLFISLRSLSAKRFVLCVCFCFLFFVFCFFVFCFANVWPWENSVPCYSYIAVPSCETIICRWCLSLVFHGLHMSVHTQKAHSCSYCTKKTGESFQMEDLFSSFHQLKLTSLAFADFSWLSCKPNEFSVKNLLWSSRIHNLYSDCFYGTTCCLNSCWVLEVMDFMGTRRDSQAGQREPMLKITPVDRTDLELFH